MRPQELRISMKKYFSLNNETIVMIQSDEKDTDSFAC